MPQINSNTWHLYLTTDVGRKHYVEYLAASIHALRNKEDVYLRTGKPRKGQNSNEKPRFISALLHIFK